MRPWAGNSKSSVPCGGIPALLRFSLGINRRRRNDRTAILLAFLGERRFLRGQLFSVIASVGLPIDIGI